MDNFYALANKLKKAKLWLLSAILCCASFGTWAIDIAFVSASTSASGGGAVSSLSVAKPVGLAIGDVMLAQLTLRTNVNVSSGMPGWALVARQLNTNSVPGLNTEVWVKTAVASDVAAVTIPWNFTTSGRGGMSISVYRNVDPVSSIEAAGALANTASATYTAPSVTTVTPRAMVVAMFDSSGSNTVPTAPTGYAQAYTNAGAAGPNGASMAGFYLLDVVPGPTGPITDAGNQVVPSTGVTVALRPIGPSNFSVVPASATPSTCAPTTTTVRALYSDGSVATTFTGTITLSTSTAHGTWALSTGAGAFVAGSADSGAASYTFAAGDNGVVVFSLSNQRAETLTQSVAWGVLASGTSSAVVFSDNAFVVVPVDVLGLQVVAGRPHAFTASFQRRDTTTGLCGAVTGYLGSKTLDAWHATTGAHPAGATAPAISSASSCAGSTTIPALAPAVSAGSNNVTLTFAAGTATFYLCTADVGQYAINLRDDTLGYAGTVVSGASGTASVRPFALWTDNVVSGTTANPGGTALAGLKFIPAQTAFSARVSAKLWAAGQDSTLAGQPNAGVDLSTNGGTLSFAAVTTLTTVAGSQTPAAGVMGTLSGGALAASAFASGQATAGALSYAEAGSVRLIASSANYLASGFSVPGVSTANVGRFHPANLVLAATAATYATPACVAGGFTYMDQPFALGAQLVAQGALGSVLSNYDAALGYAFLAVPAWRAVDSANGVNLGARLSTGPAPAWSAGRWTYASAAAVFQRAAAGPDGQYDSLRLGLSGADADGAAIASLDMSSTVPGACSGAGCDTKAVGSASRARYGRLQMDSAFGSVLNTLRMPVQAMYWARIGSGSSLGWAVNTLDSCTALPYSALSMGGYAGGLSAGSVTVPAGSLALSSGLGVIPATRTGNATVAGSVTFVANLGPVAASPAGCASGMPSVPGANLSHLRSSFCAAGYANNPGAKIVWGAPAAKSGSTIFMRELY